MTELLTVAQVAARLGLTRFHVARLIQAGRLKAIKPGHDYLIDADDLAAFQRRPVGRPTGSKDSKPRKRQGRTMERLPIAYASTWIKRYAKQSDFQAVEFEPVNQGQPTEVLDPETVIARLFDADGNTCNVTAADIRGTE